MGRAAPRCAPPAPAPRRLPMSELNTPCPRWPARRLTFHCLHKPCVGAGGGSAKFQSPASSDRASHPRPAISPQESPQWGHTGVGCGKGRNDTFKDKSTSFLPSVFAGEQGVGPSEGRDVWQEFGDHGHAGVVVSIGELSAWNPTPRWSSSSIKAMSSPARRPRRSSPTFAVEGYRGS